MLGTPNDVQSDNLEIAERITKKKKKVFNDERGLSPTKLGVKQRMMSLKK